MGGADGRHWEGVLVPRNVTLTSAFYQDFPRSLEIPKAMAFGPDRHAYSQLSPNHWKLGTGAELVRAAAWGTPQEYDEARVAVIAGLELEERAWWTTEQCAGGSHDGYHAEGELLWLTGALKKQDRELLEWVEPQVERTLIVASHTTTANGCCVCIGERPGPVLAHLSALWRIADDLPHQGALRRDPGALHTDPYWTPERLATKLHHDGHLPHPGANAPLPVMRRKLTIYRWDKTHVTVMAADSKSPRAWAKCQGPLVEKWENRPQGKAPLGVLYDTTGTLSFPAIPAGAEKIESGRAAA